MFNKTEKPTNKQPVVVVMGHVDHGKSSLLESIREEFSIVAKESGGITQHIGAYEADIDGKKITFIDTPGHEAFSAMRERGAMAADIGILVVDASEGVKPQTKEALEFIKKSKLPFLVAFNKMDKPGADPEKVKNELSRIDVLVESWGGKVPSCNVSAVKKQGIKELLETILLLNEMEDLQAETNCPFEGVVIESSMDSQAGAKATALLKKGIMKKGDVFSSASAFGKIKGIMDFRGKLMEEVLPGQPARISGFDKPPSAGEVFCQSKDLSEAQKRVLLSNNDKSKKNDCLQNENNDLPNLRIIIKADFLGSLEAIAGVLKTIPKEKVGLSIVKIEAGEINANDIKLAEDSGAAVFGFRVKISETIKNFAKQRKVLVKSFDVIYDLSQAVRSQMIQELEPQIKRVEKGKIKIIAIFKQGKEVQIIGGKVLNGEITNNTKAEVVRNEELVGKGKVKSIQKEKKEIGKATKGQEVGMFFQGDIKIELDDVLEIYQEEKVKDLMLKE